MSKSSRSPYVAVLTDVVKDESFAVLGDVAGYNRHEALGRMVELWAFCRDRKIKDAPDECDGYAVSDAVVRRYLGPEGVRGILGDGCPEFALGERLPNGLIYLRGTAGTVAALRAHVANASAGGRARTCGDRDTGGRFTGSESVSEPTIAQPDATRTPAGEPAESSLPPSSFLLPPERENAASPLALSPVGAVPTRKPRRPRVASPHTPLPEGWTPRDHERSKAREIGLDPDREAEKFKNNAAAKGHVYANWDAAFRTWLGNAPEFNASRGPPSRGFQSTDGIRRTNLL